MAKKSTIAWIGGYLKNKPRFLLLIVLFFGLFLRVCGIGFGLYHADEPIVVNHALAYATGDLNPHFFKIPPLTSYFLFAIYGTFFLFGKLAGAFASVADFEKLFFQRPEVFYTIGRFFLGAVLGTATVYALYRGASRYFGRRAALFSAFLLAFNFLHGRDSHFIYADIPMTLFVTGCIFSSLLILRETGWGAYWRAGLFLGIACAFKYNAAIAAVSILAAHGLKPKRSWFFLILTGFFSLGIYLILNPFSLKDFAFFLREFGGQGSVEGHAGALYHLKNSLVYACGVPLILSAVWGWLLLWKTHRQETKVILSFVAAFYTVLIFFSQTHERYVLPLVPFVCLGAGILADRVIFWTGKWIKIAAGILLLAAWMVPAVKLARADILFSRPDTRDLAKAWIEKNILEGEKVAFAHSFQRPRLKRSDQQWNGLETAGHLQAERLVKEKKYALSGLPGYYLYFLSDRSSAEFTQSQPVFPFDLNKLRQEGIGYVVIHYQADEPHPLFYDDLKASGRLVARFSPYRDPAKQVSLDRDAVTAAAASWEELFSRRNFGPVLEIYRIRENR